ncbi:MAG: hypothetical protein WBP61_15340 [Nocardioides sp.]
MTDDDRELRERLQASDPAASLPPADPAGVARLLEDVMSTELTTENRETGTRRRSPLTWLVAAAAVLIIAGIGLFAILGQDDGPTAPPTALDEPTVTELAAPAEAAYAARCMVPNADLLAQQDIAFDGTVTAIDDDAVTLSVEQWYAGDPTDVVQVQAPAEELQRVAAAVDFEDGGRYLVSATDGRVTLCGFSAPYTADLAGLYTQAFA